MADKPPGDGRLEGWDAIAAHLRASPRTAQRWERELGLPVRHAGRGKGYRVFAYIRDLNDWQDRTEITSSATGESASSPKPNLAQTTEPEPPPSPRLRRLLWLVLGAVAMAITIAALIASKTARPAQDEVGVINFSGQQMIASANGKFLWSDDFGQPVAPKPPGGPPFALILDMNHDRHKEVVAAVPLLTLDQSSSAFSTALYAFSSVGHLLWRDEFNQRATFAGENAEPPWQARTMLSTDDGKSRTVWVALDSALKSIALLLRVDPNGRIATQFVNYGHLQALAEVKTGPTAYLVAGGINNECDCAALAVLKIDTPSGHSPQSPSLSTCRECPPGAPVRYFLLPRSEVNLLSGASYNGVIRIDVDGPRLRVMTYEFPPDDSVTLSVADWALYEFHQGFVPTSVIFSDRYWDDHRNLSSEGKIPHLANLCPVLRQGVTIRSWSPETGWKDIQLPPVVAPPSTQYPSQRTNQARTP